jgi:hypothetical protein
VYRQRDSVSHTCTLGLPLHAVKRPLPGLSRHVGLHFSQLALTGGAVGENAQHRLLPALHALANALEAKGAEFELVVKLGRTHLQDAVPMTGA